MAIFTKRLEKDEEDHEDHTGFVMHSLLKMRPIDSLDENEIPILFLHGAEDSFILPKNSEDMAKRTKGKSEIHLIPGAEHAKSILTDPILYQKYVEGFLEDLGM